MWWLPGLMIRKLLLPLEAEIEHILNETEAHVAQMEAEINAQTSS